MEGGNGSGWAAPCRFPRPLAGGRGGVEVAGGEEPPSGHIAVAAMSGRGLILFLCAAEVLTMAGVFAFPALLPTFVGEWGLSKTEAGWNRRPLLRRLCRDRAARTRA